MKLRAEKMEESKNLVYVSVPSIVCIGLGRWLYVLGFRLCLIITFLIINYEALEFTLLKSLQCFNFVYFNTYYHFMF